MRESASMLAAAEEPLHCLTFRIGDMLLALPVTELREIIPAQKPISVPMAPNSVAGLLQHKGRILTVLDLHRALKLGSTPPRTSRMLLVEQDAVPYALIVDTVEDFVTVAAKGSTPPPHLKQPWNQLALAVHPQEDELLVVLTVSGILAALSKEQLQ